MLLRFHLLLSFLSFSASVLASARQLWLTLFFCFLSKLILFFCVMISVCYFFASFRLHRKTKIYEPKINFLTNTIYHLCVTCCLCLVRSFALFHFCHCLFRFYHRHLTAAHITHISLSNTHNFIYNRKSEIAPNTPNERKICKTHHKYWLSFCVFRIKN